MEHATPHLQISSAFLMSPATAATFLAQNWIAGVSRTAALSCIYDEMNVQYYKISYFVNRLQPFTDNCATNQQIVKNYKQTLNSNSESITFDALFFNFPALS